VLAEPRPNFSIDAISGEAVPDSGQRTDYRLRASGFRLQASGFRKSFSLQANAWVHPNML
jgi:hypothetical protein